MDILEENGLVSVGDNDTRLLESPMDDISNGSSLTTYSFVDDATSIGNRAPEQLGCHFPTIFNKYTNSCVKGIFRQFLHHHPTIDPIVYGTIFPILLILVAITNVFVVIVLSKQHMVHILISNKM